jgi:hypothetical protein
MVWSGGHCIVIKGQMRFPRFRPAAIQIAILALAAMLNFHQIGRSSLWNDEAFSERVGAFQITRFE